MYLSKILISLSLFAVLALCGYFLFKLVDGRLDAATALAIKTPGEIIEKDWLANDVNNRCESDPCLVVEHAPSAIRISIKTFDPSPTSREDRLVTTVMHEQNQNEISLTAQHDPVPDIQDELIEQGVDLEIFRNEVVLFSVNGSYTWRDADIELPYGVLAQFFFDGILKTDRAMGNQTDIEQLQEYAKIAANEVNERFGLSSLAENARIAQIARGPIQTLTYGTALIAVIITIFEIFAPSIRRYSDGMADLIPFTGFFGTLIGVAGGLEVLGLSDVTDDVSKALSLGKIGSSLGLAINTTILAIVVFAFVLVFQFAFRMLLESRTSESRHAETRGG